MATRSSSSRGRSGSRSGRSRNSGGFGSFLLGFLVALCCVVGGGWLYLRYGHPPAPVARLFSVSPSTLPSMAPTEAPAEPKPPASRETARDIARPAAHQLPQPPFGISEDVFESGAHIYKARCAQCHGTPGRNAPASPQPAALQLWKKGIHGGIGVSAKDPGDTFEKTHDGIEHTGMPSYHRLLTDTQIWQVTLLLKNADQPLPDPVQQILR